MERSNSNNKSQAGQGEVVQRTRTRPNQPGISQQNQRGASSGPGTGGVVHKSKAAFTPRSGAGGNPQVQPKPNRPNPAEPHAGPRSFARFIKPARRLSQEQLGGEPNIKGIARLMELFGVEQVQHKADQARQLFGQADTPATSGHAQLPQAESAGSPSIMQVATGRSGLESDQTATPTAPAAPSNSTVHFTEGGKARSLGGVFFALMREYARSQGLKWHRLDIPAHFAKSSKSKI